MSEAPEHIYVGPSVDDKGVFWDVGHWDKEPYDGCLKYVRADRIEELEAKLEKVVESFHDIAKDLDKPESGLTDFGEREHYRWAAVKLRDKARTALAEITGGKDE